MANQRYAGKSEEYDNDFELERDRYHHSDRHHSPVRSRRHQNRESRSRSRSVERHRRRRNSPHSRSRSRSRGYNGRRYTKRRHRDSRSRSRSRSGSHKQRSRRYSRSSSPDRHSSRRHSHKNREISSAVTSVTSAPHIHAMLVGPSTTIGLENLPLPASVPLPGSSRREAIGAYYNLNIEEPIDKARIHREMEEKLRQALAREGKVYPPPKPEASHPVFANDGSFLEIFKKMQQQTCGVATVVTGAVMPPAIAAAVAAVPPIVGACTLKATPAAVTIKTAPPPPPPLVGRRRGGKILKTGLVAKPKVQVEGNADPKDFWALYLAEVNKYKNNACESDGGTRPLVK